MYQFKFTHSVFLHCLQIGVPGLNFTTYSQTNDKVSEKPAVTQKELQDDLKAGATARTVKERMGTIWRIQQNNKPKL